MPVTPTVNVTALLTTTDCDTGWFVMFGGRPTTSVATALVTAPELFVITTV